jgi:hypothetical protein
MPPENTVGSILRQAGRQSKHFGIPASGTSNLTIRPDSKNHVTKNLANIPGNPA